jgi:hypothetical protein
MSTPNQIIGGPFVDNLGNPIANGSLVLKLSQDAQANQGLNNVQVGSGLGVTVPLDSNGNIITSPNQLVWPNDVLTPAGTFYNVSAYNQNGQRVWGPNAQTVLSTTSPFDISVWLP